MNSSRESMDLGISQTGKNTAYSRIRANNHIVMSEVRCSSLENVYIGLSMGVLTMAEIDSICI
jgi:hypothetical protein